MLRLAAPTEAVTGEAVAEGVDTEEYRLVPRPEVQYRRTSCTKTEAVFTLT